MVLDILLTGYLFVGLLYWFWLAIGGLRTYFALPRLAEVAPPEPDDWPKLSIVVPAANEAKTVEPAVRTLLEQDYPKLEIILVNDRSTDGTGEAIDRLAAADPRVQPVHIAELPEGWLGKVHALDCGAARAGGDWLLLTDADVHFAAGALRRAVAYAEHRGLDHLAVAPELWAGRFPVDAAVAVFLRTFCVATRCWAVADPRSKAFIGVGAFNLVRRTTLERSEGFAGIRLDVADDLALGWLLKRSGARSALLGGCGLIAVNWYPTLAAMAHGSEKAFASLGRCSFRRMIAVGVGLLALEWTAVAALGCLAHEGLRPAAVALLAACLTSVLVAQRFWRRRLLPGLAFPLVAVLGLWLQLRSGWLGFRRGGVLWRGTLYPSRVLREGARMPFP